jgi:hypothetical protein
MPTDDQVRRRKKDIPEGDDEAEAYFGPRFLGTCSALRLAKNRKGAFVLTERRWFFFIPLGTTKTSLRGYYSVSLFRYRQPTRYIVELEGSGRSEKIYEGGSYRRADWLVTNLQELLGLVLKKTTVI